MSRIDQLSLFDFIDPEVGQYVEDHGAIICHCMRKGYIGRKVAIDKSTQSHDWFQIGILEDYIPHEGRWRSIVYTGEKQRQLITHYPGIEIFEIRRR